MSHSIAQVNNIRILVTNINIKVRVIQFWYMYSNNDRDIFKPLETFIYHLAQGPARYLCLSCTYRGTASQTLSDLKKTDDQARVVFN